MTLDRSILKSSESIPPPVADIHPHRLEKHGDVRNDPYFWLRERENEKVHAYLRAENTYTKSMMKPLEECQKTLFIEMKSRIKEEDTSAPEKDGDYYYYSRFETGKEYPIYCRKQGSLNASEEIILNVNELAQGHSFFNVGALALSTDHCLLAFAVDQVGRRVHKIYFKDLKSGRILDDRIEDVTGNMVWANDNRTLFYSKQNLETLRSDRIFKHTLKVDGAVNSVQDKLVYEELDDTFSVIVYKTSSRRFLVISADSTMTAESRYLDAHTPEGEFKVFHPRERGHEYSINEGGNQFFILSNDHARNFKLLEAPFEQHKKENWKEIAPHREDVLVEGFLPFKNHLVLQERQNGLTQIQVMDRRTQKSHYLQFSDPVYLSEIARNREFDTVWLRFDYESMTRPESVFDYNLETGEQVLRKQREVSGYSSELYESKRLFVKTSDGVDVPISLVKKKSTPKSSETPCLVYGYGSYGLSMDPNFSTVWLSLLDRGFVVVIAHVRGGSEMGRTWYENGRQMNKKNSFSDFIASTEFLIREGWTSPEHLYAMGGSAGGLLMGTVMNWRPDLYRGVVASVPFVDVISTMLDESIPLTTGEYDEWGNPNDKSFYDYIRSYSPYDNLKKQNYPHLLVTTGLHDSQVQYWEPAKWVAKLRTLNQGSNLILLWTEMEAGHGGKTGRFDRLYEEARIYSFLLGLEGRS